MFANKTVSTAMFIVMMFAANSYAGEIWKIASLDWQPYSGSDMATQGNSVQKLRELLKKEGISLEVVFFPWLRSKDMAKTKEYVGYFPAWPEEVEEGFVASPPVDWSEIGILKVSGKTVKYENVDELFKKFKVGIVRTYVYPEIINNAVKKYPENVDDAADELILMKKLSGGRDHVAITDPSVMLYSAGKEGINNIELVEIIMKKELVVAFRSEEDNKDRINLLKKILSQ